MQFIYIHRMWRYLSGLYIIMPPQLQLVNVGSQTGNDGHNHYQSLCRIRFRSMSLPLLADTFQPEVILIIANFLNLVFHFVCVNSLHIFVLW